MAITATELRSKVYTLLDQVIETGEPLLIQRNGRTLKITLDKRPGIFERLVPRPDLINGDPEELIHLDWSHLWKP